MNYDPRDRAGPFGQLLRDLRRCKESRKCPSLRIRSYYFEPNPETADDWRNQGFYQGEIDSRIVFVCESPGSSGGEIRSPDIKRCWAESWRDKRFQNVLLNYQLQNCYIANTVKCGVRQGGRHSDSEIDACIEFLVRELELIQPMIAVGVGGNAFHTLRTRVSPRLKVPPVLFQITHYSARRNVRELWDQEFSGLLRLRSRLQPRSKWKI